MIDLKTAHGLILAYLAKAERDMNGFGSALPGHKDKPHIHLVVSKVIEYDFGWVFCYNAKEYLETNDMELGLTGNAPLIVDRNDGQLYITSTAYPIEHYLDQYRKGVRTRAHV